MMSNSISEIVSNGEDQSIEDEIADLERRLAEAKAKRSSRSRQLITSHSPKTIPPSPSHFLLLLSDSALPLGSFAFSSGLESYLAHHKYLLSSSSFSPPAPATATASFDSFLPLSVSSYASTSLPFLLAGFRDPSCGSLARLDDAQDASIICAVGRRASVAQGRALLGIWERSFQQSELLFRTTTTTTTTTTANDAAENLRSFSRLVKKSAGEQVPAASAHLAPLFGAVCRLAGLSAQEAAYVFMFGHVKALVSAAVRAGMFGPYQAQRTLASGTVQGLIDRMIEREWNTDVEDAGQSVPVMDLWFGRHEMLYSRIFNS